MKPILCIGETANERAAGETMHVLHDQLTSGLLNVTSDEIKNIAVAYEPVWAIGTGDPVKPSDLGEVTAAIRKQVKALYGVKASDEIRILYGGSVNADNASNFLTVDGVDGFLIGGASLKADEFASIVEKAHNDSK